MTDTATIQGQEATVHLANGDAVPVRIANPDLVRWDLTAHKHKWPDMESAPILWATFVAWAAMTRQGLTTAKWEEFQSTECMGVEMAEAEPVDPTPPGAEPASA